MLFSDPQAANAYSELPGQEPGSHPNPTDAKATLFADAVQRVGMAGPAMIVLEIAKPLAWVFGQMAWALQPFLGSTNLTTRWRLPSVAGIATFLESEGSLDTLLDQLQSPGSKVSSPRSEAGIVELRTENPRLGTGKEHELR